MMEHGMGMLTLTPGEPVAAPKPTEAPLSPTGTLHSAGPDEVDGVGRPAQERRSTWWTT